MRLIRLFVAAAMVCAAFAVTGAGEARAAGGLYVALGDSYTSGPLIPGYEKPYGCLRSTNNYPHLFARQRKTQLRDASCSGADTKDMTGVQGVSPGPNPAQYDRLGPDVNVVTLQIGGNDIGFSGIAESCFAPLPQGTPCQDAYVVDGQDIFSQRVAAAAPKVAAAIAGIGTRAPNARVYVLGYPSIVPESDSPLATAACWPQLPMSPQDIPWVRAKVKELNAMIAAQAAANGATYVDIYTPSIGRDACAPPLLRWVEPLVIVGPAAPVHPNLTGMIGITKVLQATIG
jgi:lysophospholipase L1-like esterase